MKVLITGGTGDIGRALAERLWERGWDLRLIGLEDPATVDVAGAEFDYA